MASDAEQFQEVNLLPETSNDAASGPMGIIERRPKLEQFDRESHIRRCISNAFSFLKEEKTYHAIDIDQTDGHDSSHEENNEKGDVKSQDEGEIRKASENVMANSFTEREVVIKELVNVSSKDSETANVADMDSSANTSSMKDVKSFAEKLMVFEGLAKATSPDKETVSPSTTGRKDVNSFAEKKIVFEKMVNGASLESKTVSKDNVVKNEHSTVRNSFAEKEMVTEKLVNDISPENDCVSKDIVVDANPSPGTSSQKDAENEQQVLLEGNLPTIYKTVITIGSDQVNDSKLANGDEPDAASEDYNVVKRVRAMSLQSTQLSVDSNDSSDEDTGIYAATHRNSRWIRSRHNDSPDTLNLSESLTREIVEGGQSPSEDEVFSTSLPIVNEHKRSQSNASTNSETEFKKKYFSKRKCLIQRHDSQQEYQRASHRFYDQEKIVILEKDENTSDFGLHIFESHPAMISAVDAGSPAETGGVEVGQILVSINDINVLESSHQEIIDIIQANSHSVILEVGQSDVVHNRDLHADILSGYLYKLGSTAFLKTWKKRWFILRQDNCLYYYRSEKDLDPMGAIPMSNYFASRYHEKDFSFKAEKYGARTYYFMAENKAEMNQWAQAISNAAKSSQRKDSWLNVTSHNVGLPALEIRRPECAGYLYKMGQKRKNWRKRYCLLKDACVYYYKHRDSQSAQGVAHLHGYSIDSSAISGKKHGFLLRAPEEGMRTFSFNAENDTDRSRWIEAFKESIGRWVRVS